jgi:hypothetical protein
VATRRANPERIALWCRAACAAVAAATAMRNAKQKPNEACACGSGAKHKRCCGAAGAVAAAAAPPPPPPPPLHQPGASASEVEAQVQEVERLWSAAYVAREEANMDRGVRRMTAALALAGDALCNNAAPNDVRMVLFAKVIHSLLYLLYAPSVSRRGCGRLLRARAGDADAAVHFLGACADDTHVCPLARGAGYSGGE